MSAAWRTDANPVFVDAMNDGGDVLLWWTAPWCPPCNELAFLVFSRPEFVACTDALHCLKLDADAPLAQRWGDRFGLRSYPAAWLLDAGSVPRLCLPMATDAAGAAAAIALAQRLPPLPDSVAAVQSGATLDADARQRLALHWWAQDTTHVADPQAREALLAALCAQAVDDAPAIRLRLLIHWLDAAKALPAAPPRAGFGEVLLTLLREPTHGYAETYLLWVGLHTLQGLGEAAQPALLDACRDALERQLAAGLAGTQRLIARHALLQVLEDAHADAATLRAARAAAADDARRIAATCAPEEWISVTNMAGHLLHAAGDTAAATALFAQAATQAAHPGYFMQYLGDFAFESEDVEAGLDWWQRARAATPGAATRFAMAVRRAARVMTHAPFDVDGIDAAVRDAVRDLADCDAPTAGNNRRNLELLMQQLQAWRATSGRCESGCDGALCA